MRSYFSFAKYKKVLQENKRKCVMEEDRLIINLYGSCFYMIGWKIELIEK